MEASVGYTEDRVRVVILNYNRAELTSRCVRFVLAQDYGKIDIVIIDNGSTEEEYGLLRRLLPPTINVIRNEVNRGFAAGNNVGVSQPECEWPAFFLFMNNDVFLEAPDTIRQLVRALRTKSDRVACSPLVNSQPSTLPVELQIQVRRIPNFYELLVVGSPWLRRVPGLTHLHSRYVYSDIMPFVSGEAIDCETVNCSCFVMQSSFLRRLGGFDEGTFLYFEEIVLGAQIKSAGKVACLVTSTQVRHEQGSTGGQRRGFANIRYEFYMLKSQMHFIRSYLGKSYLGMALAGLIRFSDVLAATGWAALECVSSKVSSRLGADRS